MTIYKKRKIDKYDFKQVKYFFNSKRSNNYGFDLLMKTLEQKGDVIVIGGVIRDIIINKCEPRDIDLIVDTEELDEIMRNFEFVSKNRFGGYKLNINGLEIDVWSIDNHWAFKEKILKKSFENIEYSTFLNFDSAFYSVTRDIGCADVFNESMSNSYLDITLEDEYIYKNPSVATNIIKMFSIKEQWGLNFSDKVDDYISMWVTQQNRPLETLYIAREKHYKNKESVNEENLKRYLQKYME